MQHNTSLRPYVNIVYLALRGNLAHWMSDKIINIQLPVEVNIKIIMAVACSCHLRNTILGVGDETNEQKY